MDSLHSFFLLLSVLLYLKQFNIFILIKCLFILNSSAEEQRERGRRGDTFKDLSFDKCSLANDNIMEMDQHCPWNSFLLLFCSKPSLTVAPPDSPSGHNRQLLGRRRMRFIFHSSPYDLSYISSFLASLPLSPLLLDGQLCHSHSSLQHAQLEAVVSMQWCERQQWSYITHNNHNLSVWLSRVEE